MKTRSLNPLIFSFLLAGSMAASPIATAAGEAGTGNAARQNSQGFLNAPKKTTLATTGRDPSAFPAYVETLKDEARRQGIDEATLDAAFAQVHFVDRAIQADRDQPEKKITLSDYLVRVLPQAKIDRAREKLQEHQQQLLSVSRKTGVQPEYNVALWAIESNFGRIQGREDVISALATMAFEGRREAFFTRELIAALTMIQQKHVEASMMKGSWAGAMGQNQFMPSSFLTYGKDGDGDGIIDIWQNSDDVFASTANYLVKEGWQAGESWGREVVLPADFRPALAGLKTEQAKSVGEWRAMGVRTRSDAALPADAVRAWLITPDDPSGRAFMVYDNFRTIMHWNRSLYFAISIGMMADAISQ
ncbi:lytic murein transglycosylase [Erwinia sp. P6884]|uniref:lytic murein transglycosylase n=1 Tax=Erwinia sp. P6884 TaxID=3141450 RepID=UPI00319BE8C0